MECDHSEAERAQHIKQIYDLQEHIQQKDRKLIEFYNSFIKCHDFLNIWKEGTGGLSMQRRLDNNASQVPVE